MRILLTVLLTVLLSLPAFAQQRRSVGSAPAPDPAVEARKRQDAADLDRAYKAATESVPATAVKRDPWSGVREADPSSGKKK